MIIEKIKQLKIGTRIPKPNSQEPYIILGWGKSRGERALRYSIPKKQTSKKQNIKRIRASDFEKAYKSLKSGGQFTRNWFEINMPDCAKDGGCNFTTIGGIFELIGVAYYDSPGIYKLLSAKD